MSNEIFISPQPTLFDSAFSIDQANKIHASFVEIIRMGSDEFNNKTEKLRINYSFYKTKFGETVIASTSKGICYIGFFENQQKALSELKFRFPHAQVFKQSDDFQQNVLNVLENDCSKFKVISLHLFGTDFQLEIWKLLLKIPSGNVVTYGDLANEIQKPKAARAVGTAIGSNPIAFLIPCHRVIQASGALGGYRWGIALKKQILLRESAE